MAFQYLRKLSVVVSSAGKQLDFADFRVVFRVRRGDLQTPNSADVRIYNLSPNTVATIASPEFTTLTIQAGYSGSYGLIFQGTIKQFRKGRVNGKDTFVDITAADGDEAYQFATVFHSAPAGTTADGIAQALLKAFQAQGLNQAITNGYQPSWPGNGLIRGRVMCGLARDEARDFANSTGCSWSIQDGALTFIPLTSYIPGDVPVISPQSGLLDVPEATSQGIHMKVLLNPNMRVGQCVKLENTAINQLRYGLDRDSVLANEFLSQHILTANPSGLYYVMQANHSGDSRGNEWVTDMMCLAVDASVPFPNIPSALNPVGPVPINRY